MAQLMRVDGSYSLAMTSHPKIQSFLRGISEQSAEFLRYCDPVKLRQYCLSTRGDVLRVEASWRSFADQQTLYNSTRLPFSAAYGKPHVTFAKAGDSLHNWGLAVDLVWTRTGYDVAYYDKRYFAANKLADFFEATGLVAYARACGLRWLGRDPQLVDVAHFEYGSLPLSGERKEEKAKPGWWDETSRPLQSTSQDVHGGGSGKYGDVPVSAAPPSAAASAAGLPWWVFVCAAAAGYLVIRKNVRKNKLLVISAAVVGVFVFFPDIARAGLRVVSNWFNRRVVDDDVHAGYPFGGWGLSPGSSGDSDAWYNRSVID